MRPWAEVVDRISLKLAESRDAAVHSADTTKARQLADDAYWVEFEASDLETAVQRYVGFGRKGELERQFRAIRTAVREVGATKRQRRGGAHRTVRSMDGQSGRSDEGAQRQRRDGRVEDRRGESWPRPASVIPRTSRPVAIPSTLLQELEARFSAS